MLNIDQISNSEIQEKCEIFSVFYFRKEIRKEKRNGKPLEKGVATSRDRLGSSFELVEPTSLTHSDPRLAE